MRLTCHPATPAQAAHAVAATARRLEDGDLFVGFGLDGMLGRLKIPAPCAAEITDLLWQHTCFEAFVAVDGAPGYHELNLAPSGAWAARAFRRYREGTLLTDGALAPRIAVRSTPERLELDAVLPLARLSPEYSRAVLRIGLAAVVEEVDGTLSYWSLCHPPGKPDFHHADAFALRLEPHAA
jgi:hypothetical protein